MRMEAYRSGHNEAVLKTVWVQAHRGSNPFASAIATMAQQVEHILGKDEVTGSNPVSSSNEKMRAVWHAFSFENALPLSCIFSFLTRNQIFAINSYSRCKLPRCFANLFACFARFACNSVKIAIFHIISLFIQISDCAVSLILTNHPVSVHIAWCNIGVPTI